MAELTLKDESVLEIGKSVSQSFEGLAKTGKSLLVMPSGQPLQVKADDVEVLDKQPEKSTAQAIFENIRDGVNKLVEVFTSSFNFQKQEAAEEDLQARVTEGQATELAKEDDGTDRSFFTQEFKDKISELTAGIKERTMAIFGGIGGMLKKGGLLALLLVFALNINKFSDQIGETLKPILEGFKRAFDSLKEDIFPVIEGIIETFGIAFETVSNLLKGLFQGDGSLFVKGLKGLIFDLPLKLASIFGDAFFSLLDAALKFFGVESQFIQDVKMFYRELPEKISELIKNSISFITETIPQYFENLKNNVVNYVEEKIESIKQMFRDAFNFITEDIPNYFSGLVDSVINSIKETVQSIKDAIMAPIKAIKDKIGGVFSGVKDFFTGGEDQAKAKDMANQMSGDNLKKNAFKIMSKDVNDNKDEINTFMANTPYRLDMKGSLFNYELGNRQLVFESGKFSTHISPGDFKTRLEDIIKFNSTKPYTPDLSTNSNMPTISPQDLEKGKQLNTESAALNSGTSSQSNLQVNNGGTTNNTTANNTYTTILEDTATSDRNLRHYLSA